MVTFRAAATHCCAEKRAFRAPWTDHSKISRKMDIACSSENAPSERRIKTRGARAVLRYLAIAWQQGKSGRYNACTFRAARARVFCRAPFCRMLLIGSSISKKRVARRQSRVCVAFAASARWRAGMTRVARIQRGRSSGDWAMPATRCPACLRRACRARGLLKERGEIERNTSYQLSTSLSVSWGETRGGIKQAQRLTPEWHCCGRDAGRILSAVTWLSMLARR